MVKKTEKRIVVRVSETTMKSIRAVAAANKLELGLVADQLIGGASLNASDEQGAALSKDAEKFANAYAKKHGVTCEEAISSLVCTGHKRLEALAKYNKKSKTGGL